MQNLLTTYLTDRRQSHGEKRRGMMRKQEVMGCEWNLSLLNIDMILYCRFWLIYWCRYVVCRLLFRCSIRKEVRKWARWKLAPLPRRLQCRGVSERQFREKHEKSRTFKRTYHLQPPSWPPKELHWLQFLVTRPFGRSSIYIQKERLQGKLNWAIHLHK